MAGMIVVWQLCEYLGGLIKSALQGCLQVAMLPCRRCFCIGSFGLHTHSLLPNEPSKEFCVSIDHRSYRTSRTVAGRAQGVKKLERVPLAPTLLAVHTLDSPHTALARALMY